MSMQSRMRAVHFVGFLLFLLPRIGAQAQVCITDVTDPDLDMHRQIQAHRSEVRPLVEKGPKLVVGQGADAGNYTLVRCLDEYGVPYLQFLAYPSNVRGGVCVSAGNVLPHAGVSIVANPISSTASRKIIIFTDRGVLRSEIDPAGMRPPFTVAVGDFLPRHPGDEIAVTSRYPVGPAKARIYDGRGRKLAEIKAPRAAANSNGQLLLWNNRPDGAGSVDVARREKCFFISPAPSDSPWTDSPYVKNARFRHIRADQSSPGYSPPNLDFNNNDYNHWAGASLENTVRKHLADYFTGPPSVWGICFSHRHHSTASQSWFNKIDPATGLRQYAMLTRLNNPVTYTEGDTTFNSLTYGPGLPAMDHLFIWPMRTYLLRLASAFRGHGGNPDKVVAVEPNHEFEIYCPQDDTVGDYNTNMIHGFYKDLLRRYASLAKINVRFGAGFSPATFDAPRNSRRGAWDAYDAGNAFFNAWVEYNRKVIFCRLAQGEREALLAGFPPALIKTHQIPADYAVGPVVKNRRITPVDWTLSGPAGYGGTRYGLWYTWGDFVAGAFSSGFNMIDIGEYNPMTTDQNQANAQDDYIWNHGVNFITSMAMDPAMDPVAQAAYLRLRDYGPRPGTAQGIGQIRAVRQPTAGGFKRYNIVCIGDVGLLKSVNNDGSWEGTVYAEPFRQRVMVDPLRESVSFELGTAGYSVGPVQGLRAGDQLELCFKARSAGGAKHLTLSVLHDGVEMPGHRFAIDLTPGNRFYRYTLRVQEPMDPVSVVISSGERTAATARRPRIAISDLSAWAERIAVARPDFGINAGTANRGGVTFDVLSRAYIAR